MTNDKNNCHQCGKHTQGLTKDENYAVCVRPECPNYGLLQIGEEQMDKFISSL